MDECFVVVEGGRRHVRLGQRIHGGGEADIRVVPDWNGYVAKIYKREMQGSHASRTKLEAMLLKAPDHMTTRAKGVDLPQFAWPTHIIEDVEGRFSGFLMPEVPTATSELLSCYVSRSQRHAMLSQEDCSLPRRLLVCANLASAITELHRRNHYVVDIKPENCAMFKDTGILCLLDNDSFSIAGSTAVFPGTAFSPGYVAPELLINEMAAKTVINDWQDRFALAVLVFQILDNGVHPFQGKPLFETEEWNNDMCIRGGLYPYGLTPHPQVAPAPTSVHGSWPLELRQMFDRAFAERQGSKRPTAKEWRNLLQAPKGRFAPCDRKPDDVLHIHFAGMPCQECLFEQLVHRQQSELPIDRPIGKSVSTPTGSRGRDPTPNSRPSVAATSAASHQASVPASEVVSPPATIAAASNGPSATPGIGHSRNAKDSASRGKPVAIAAVIAMLIGFGLLYEMRTPSESLRPAPLEATSPDQSQTPVPAAPVTSPSPLPTLASDSSASSTTEPEALARNVLSETDDKGIEARLGVIKRVAETAFAQNQDEMASIIADGIAGDDTKTLAKAKELMRNTDFVSAYQGWNYTRPIARKLNENARRNFRNDLPGATQDQLRALALAPTDREIAANLAYFLALGKQQGVLMVATYALSLPRPPETTGTASAWQMAAAALARSNRMKESEGAFYVGLAITSKLPQFCGNLLANEHDFGPELREPIDAVFKRIRDRGQSDQPGCAYPPLWQ